MPSVMTVKVEGLKQLEDALLEETPKQVRSQIRGALKYCGQWMAEKIAALAPVRTGFTARHIIYKIRMNSKKDEALLAVGPTRDAWYSTFSEFGSVHNKPPHPFIRPAFDMNADSWLELLTAKLKEALGWE